MSYKERRTMKPDEPTALQTIRNRIDDHIRDGEIVGMNVPVLEGDAT